MGRTLKVWEFYDDWRVIFFEGELEGVASG